MDFTLLGDPHLGRTFVHGVPLHRRGEREAMLWRDFAQSLSSVAAPLHICMGDLFDRAVVSYDTIVSAARLYMHAAAKFPQTKFIILRGNHDTSRDADKVSAFEAERASRAAATRVTASLLGGVRAGGIWAGLFRCHTDGSEGLGSYLLWRA